jgi:hypothetical protein
MKPVHEMTETELLAEAKAQLRKYAANDLRFHVNRIRGVTGISDARSDYESTRAVLRQLLKDLAE